MSTESEVPKENKVDGPAKNPAPIDLGSIVFELEDLVKIALAAEKNEVQITVDSFVDIHKKLMGIYKMVEQFRSEYAKSLEPLGLTPEDMKLTSEQIQELGPKERKIFEKLSSMQSICEDAKARVHKSLQESPRELKQIKDELKGPEKNLVHRKSKFKGVGGKKGWLPS